MGPFMEKQLGGESMELLRPVKKHLDPFSIFSP
jgi:FAD/FMN-containing dehydrogenase